MPSDARKAFGLGIDMIPDVRLLSSTSFHNSLSRVSVTALRRVLHLKMVTQCAVLEDFCLFIVLADKVLYAYHLEALVPTMPGSSNVLHTPQRIHSKDVQFFSVGVLHGRTLIIYMKKRGVLPISFPEILTISHC